MDPSFSPRTASTPQPLLATLPNGLRLVGIPMPWRATVSLSVFIRTGSERKALRLLYGATPGQMFKLVTQDITPELGRQIEAQILGMFTDRARVSFNTQVTRR